MYSDLVYLDSIIQKLAFQSLIDQI
jgi:hypothetical protein